MSDEDYEIDVDDLDIDSTRLEDEWRKQPRLYFLAAKLAADARAEVDRLKSVIDVTEAEVRQRVSKDPDKYGCMKDTVADINSAVTREMSNKKCMVRLRRAKHNVDVHDAFVRALDHKKRALEGHVTLFVNNYNSKPREPKDAKSREYVERMQDKQVKGVTPSEKKNRKKRRT